MLASYDNVTAEGKAEGELKMSSGGRGFVSRTLKAAAMIISLAAAALVILSQGAALPWHWCATEIAPLAGTLFLAVGAVLLANYLSVGRKSRTGHGGDLGYDRNARLDL